MITHHNKRLLLPVLILLVLFTGISKNLACAGKNPDSGFIFGSGALMTHAYPPAWEFWEEQDGAYHFKNMDLARQQVLDQALAAQQDRADAAGEVSGGDSGLAALAGKDTEAETTHVYYDQMYHVFDDTCQPPLEYLTPVSRFELSPDLYLNIFTTRHKDFDENPSFLYGPYNYHRVDAIVTNAGGRVLDRLNLGYCAAWHDAFIKLCAIDAKGVIHLKYFQTGEGCWWFWRYEQYLVTPAGHFARYYAEDDVYTSPEEWGLVYDHVREGLWWELKPNYYAGGQYTLSQCEFKGGLPDGEWQFYEALYEEDGNWLPKPETARIGRLIYREIYADGRLRERVFEPDFAR